MVTSNLSFACVQCIWSGGLKNTIVLLSWQSRQLDGVGCGVTGKRGDWELHAWSTGHVTERIAIRPAKLLLTGTNEESSAFLIICPLASPKLKVALSS